MVCNSAECNVFLERHGRFVEGSEKVPRNGHAKSKSKYDYAEYDVIRVIIVSFATAARLAEQRRVTAPRRGTHSGLRRLLRGPSLAHERVMAISGTHGVGAGGG